MDTEKLKKLVAGTVQSDIQKKTSSVIDLEYYIREYKSEIHEINAVVFKTLKQLKKNKVAPFNLATAKASYIGSMCSIFIHKGQKVSDKDISVLTLSFNNLSKIYEKNPDLEQYIANIILKTTLGMLDTANWEIMFDIIRKSVEIHAQSLLEKAFTLKMALNKDVSAKHPEFLTKAQIIIAQDLSSLIDLMKSSESTNKLHPIWTSLIAHLSAIPDIFEKFWKTYFWKDTIYCKSNKLKYTMLLALKKIIKLNNKRILKFVLCKQTFNILIQVSQKKHKLYEAYKDLFNKISKFEFTNNQAKIILKIPISLMITFPQIVSLTHFFSPFINRLQKDGLIKCIQKLYKNLPDIPDKKTYDILNFGYFLMKQRRFPCFECELEFIEKSIYANATLPTPFSDERLANLFLQSLIFCESPLKDAQNYKLYKKLLENFIIKIIEILSSSHPDANLNGQKLVADYKMLLITCKKIFKVIKGFKQIDGGNDIEILFSKLLFGTVSYQLFQIEALSSQLEDIYQAAFLAFSQDSTSELYWFDILMDIMLLLLLIPSYSAHNLVQKILEKSSMHIHESTWELLLSRFNSPDLETVETETQNLNQGGEVEDSDCPVSKVKKSKDKVPSNDLYQANIGSNLEDINLDSVDPQLLAKYDELLTKQLSIGKKSKSSKKQNEIIQNTTKIFRTRIIGCLEIMAKQELDNFTKLKLSLKIMKLTINPTISNNTAFLSKFEGLARSLISSKGITSGTNSIDDYDIIFKKYVKTANKTFTVRLSTLWAQWLVFLLKSTKVVDEKSHEQFLKNVRKFVKSILQKILTTKKEIANPLFFEILVSYSSDLVSSLKVLKLFVQHLPKCKGTNKKIPTLIQIFNSIIILNNFDETKLASIYSKLFDHDFLSSLHVDANLILPNFINGIRNLVKKNNNLTVMFNSQFEDLLLWTGLKSSAKDNIKAALNIFSSLNSNTKQ